MLALNNAKCNEATKAFLSRQYDNYRTPFLTRAEDRPRQCVFAGTSNMANTFATNGIENGMEPKVLQKILGHSTLQMTMDLYCHVREDTLIDEMARIASFM